MDFVDPGCAWLKRPVEIFCCSPYDKEEMTLAVRGCDFVIATHCNLIPAGNKNAAITSNMMNGPLNQDLKRLIAVIYLKEGIAPAKTGSAGNQKKCIRKTLSILNHHQSRTQSGRKNGRSMFVDATQVIPHFENNNEENNDFEILADKIHEIMLHGRQNERYFVQIKTDPKKTSWMLVLLSWVETGLERISQIFRLPHNLTGF